MRRWSNRFINIIERFRRLTDGNIGLTFALIITPVIIAVGAGIDLARTYNIQSKMQADLDAALIAAVKSVDTLTTQQLQQKISDWIAADGNLASTTITINNLVVDTTNHQVSATLQATVPTIFMRLANVQTVPVAAKSVAKGPSSSYLQVYIVLDKSASMLLPASQADRTNFLNLLYNTSYSDPARYYRNYLQCEFACHDFDNTYFKYAYKKNGKTYTAKFDNIYDLVKFYNTTTSTPITLRTDVSLTAAGQVIDMIANSNAKTQHITAGLYYFGQDLYTAVPQTSSTTTLKKALTDDTYGLTSATSQPVTYFNNTLSTLTKLVGTAGDGSSTSKPLKLVLILTDGAQSTRPWVLTNDTTRTYVAPMNPAWCSPMKASGVTIGVLDTEYLAIPYDWGYNDTLGMSMNSANWYYNWGGVMRSNVSGNIARRDYLQYALTDCATSSQLFISASDKTDIANGLSTIFNSYLSSVRLTQ